MNPSQFPGQTEQPVPPSALLGGDDEFSLLEKCVQLLYLLVQGGGGGGSGATIPSTTNLIKGDGAGNGADSGIVPANVVLGTVGSAANAVLVATGSGNAAQATPVKIDSSGNITGAAALTCSGNITSSSGAAIISGNYVLAPLGFYDTASNGFIAFGSSNDGGIQRVGAGRIQAIGTAGPGSLGSINLLDAVIGGSTINANAVLDVQSTTKAFMPPRMTTTQKNAIATPTAGMLVYDTTLNKISLYTGATWETVTSV